MNNLVIFFLAIVYQKTNISFNRSSMKSRRNHMLKLYGYKKCSTCTKAVKYLESKGFEVNYIDITTTPPAKTTLKAILSNTDYTLKDLFNKSGVLYREMKMKDQIKTISQKDAIDLLNQHGKLVKRPIVTDGKNYTIGFKEDVFDDVWKK